MNSAVGPARVHGDAGLLGQVVRNLVDNAARHATAHVAFSLPKLKHATPVAAVWASRSCVSSSTLTEALSVPPEVQGGGARIEVRLPASHDS